MVNKMCVVLQGGHPPYLGLTQNVHGLARNVQGLRLGVVHLRETDYMRSCPCSGRALYSDGPHIYALSVIAYIMLFARRNT